MDKYEIVRQIGRGSFGCVHLAVHRKSRKQLVIKEIRTSSLSEKERDDVDKEVRLLAKLVHPNIVEYIESFQDNAGTVFIVMEFCESGDLYNKINRQRGRLLPETLILQYFVQICKAVEFIHDRKILHRDIKSQNIFIGRHRSIKLGDFGIARILEGRSDYARTCIGTPFYLSPEVWENRPYNNKSDLWALGCVLYEMTSLRHAFEAGCMKSLILKIIRGSYPAISTKYSYDLRNLINALLKKNPKDRPAIKSILRKGFIRKAEEQLNKFLPDYRLTSKRRPETVYLVQNKLSKFEAESLSPSKKLPGNKDNALRVPEHTPGSASSDKSQAKSDIRNSTQPRPPSCSSGQRKSYVVSRIDRKKMRSKLARQKACRQEAMVSTKQGCFMWIDLSDEEGQEESPRTINSDTYVIDRHFCLEPILEESGRPCSSGCTQPSAAGATMSPMTMQSDGAPVVSVDLQTSTASDCPQPVKVRRRSFALMDTLMKWMPCTSDNGITVYEDGGPSDRCESRCTAEPDPADEWEPRSEVEVTTDQMNAGSWESECSDEEDEDMHHAALLRSYSLPDLNRTPLENLLDTDLEQEVWPAANGCQELDSPGKEQSHDRQIFSYLESQRAYLESRIGVKRLLRVYQLISSIEDTDHDQIDYRDFQKILGPGNEDLIDDIIQLAVADQFFT